MSESKISPDDKVQTVKKYLSQKRIAGKMAIRVASFQQWIRNYKTMDH